MDIIEQGLFERLINAVKNKCKRTALARIVTLQIIESKRKE